MPTRAHTHTTHAHAHSRVRGQCTRRVTRPGSFLRLPVLYTHAAQWSNAHAQFVLLTVSHIRAASAARPGMITSPQLSRQQCITQSFFSSATDLRCIFYFRLFFYGSDLRSALTFRSSTSQLLLGGIHWFSNVIQRNSHVTRSIARHFFMGFAHRHTQHEGNRNQSMKIPLQSSSGS